MELTLHQSGIYKKICDFLDTPVDISDETTYLSLLEGPAGVGKTFIMRKVVDYLNKMHKSVLGVSPTHKARKVLYQAINYKTIIKIPTKTVASLLNKTRSHSYIGTQNYTMNVANKVNRFDVLLIDEVSMIADKDYLEIIKYAQKYNTIVSVI